MVTYQKDNFNFFNQHFTEVSDDHLWSMNLHLTVALISPIIDISFGTSEAVTATEVLQIFACLNLKNQLLQLQYVIQFIKFLVNLSFFKFLNS